jgi:hypothetical protein
VLERWVPPAQERPGAGVAIVATDQSVSPRYSYTWEEGSRRRRRHVYRVKRPPHPRKRLTRIDLSALVSRKLGFRSWRRAPSGPNPQDGKGR